MRSVTIYSEPRRAIDDATGLEIDGIASMEVWYEPTEMTAEPFTVKGKRCYAFNFKDGRYEEVDAHFPDRNVTPHKTTHAAATR
jgi:hypothetical protein